MIKEMCDMCSYEIKDSEEKVKYLVNKLNYGAMLRWEYGREKYLICESCWNKYIQPGLDKVNKALAS